MIRKCISCKILIDVPSPRTRFCPPCAIISQKIKQLEWKKTNITKRDFDLFCMDCNESLPINAKKDKRYCNDCLRKRCLKSHCKWALDKRNKEKLDKFYKNIRINLIESPYLIEIKTLNKIILLENK